MHRLYSFNALANISDRGATQHIKIVSDLHQRVLWNDIRVKIVLIQIQTDTNYFVTERRVLMQLI